MVPRIERLCQTVAALHPKMKDMCLNGHCYEFALILRSQFDGEIYYSSTEGHVYFKHGGSFYDVRGKLVGEPDCCHPLDHAGGHRPHRWSKGAGWSINQKYGDL